jgi:tetratricopeptide (TPR) repeat protein
MKENVELENLFNKAKEKYDSKSYADAFHLIEEVLESGFESADAFFIYGNLLHIRGDLGKAIQAFKKAIDIDSAHTDAAVSLSILYNDIGQYDKGKAVYEVADKSITDRSKVKDPHIDKKFSQKHTELGDLYYRYHRYEEALFEFNKAINLDPNNFDSRIKMAKSLAKKGFISRAYQELKTLKSENPDYLPAGVSLGLLLYSQGKIADAQTEWERVVHKDTNHQEAKMYLRMAGRATETTL